MYHISLGKGDFSCDWSNSFCYSVRPVSVNLVGYTAAAWIFNSRTIHSRYYEYRLRFLSRGHHQWGNLRSHNLDCVQCGNDDL